MNRSFKRRGERNILVLGANGFIGSHLCKSILKQKNNWHIAALDLAHDKLLSELDHPRLEFYLGDMTQEQDWIQQAMQWADVVIPLAAIATPATYVQDPLRIFELDFEANLAIIRQCVRYHKRLIFPSTSEIYGMCPDPLFDEMTSNCVTGPIHKERWIYATTKQLLDRLIYTYGKHHQLSFSLFRPFNWYGPHLDHINNPKPGASRVLTQFIGNILRGENMLLVDGGAQQRCFTYISDGINALLSIIANLNHCATQQVFNIGNPKESISMRTLAHTLKTLVIQHYPRYAAKAKQIQLVDVAASCYYGEGYQDIALRVPSIAQAQQKLAFTPTVNLSTGLKKTLDFYLNT